MISGKKMGKNYWKEWEEWKDRNESFVIAAF